MDGLLIIDKPVGLSSHNVINCARHIMQLRRIGHTGTLDPFATGVLVLLVGRATRLAQFVNTDEKEYLAVARCGFATDTGDLTGQALPAGPDHQPIGANGFTTAEVDAAMAPLRGDILQIPPMYSAKKRAGRKLYELARRGEEVEREPVPVRIHELEFTEPFTAPAEAPPEETWDFGLRVVCSAGTYIRTLAESIGANLHIGAHLVALRRTRAGSFKLDDAVTLEQLTEAAAAGSLAELLLPSERAVERLSRSVLNAEEAKRAGHGLAVPANNGADESASGERVALFRESGELLGVGDYIAESGLIKPRVMLAGGQ
jgi:tRNA pseudouridine55 synthase